MTEQQKPTPQAAIAAREQIKAADLCTAFLAQADKAGLELHEATRDRLEKLAFEWSRSARKVLRSLGEAV